MRPAFQPTCGPNLVRADDWHFLNKNFGFDLFLTLDADQVIDNCVDVLGVDRRLVSGPHLVDLGLPLHYRQCRLIEDHVGRVAGEAIVIRRLRARPVRKHVGAGRQIDADGFERQGRLS